MLLAHAKKKPYKNSRLKLMIVYTEATYSGWGPLHYIYTIPSMHPKGKALPLHPAGLRLSKIACS